MEGIVIMTKKNKKLFHSCKKYFMKEIYFEQVNSDNWKGHPLVYGWRKCAKCGKEQIAVPLMIWEDLSDEK